MKIVLTHSNETKLWCIVKFKPCIASISSKGRGVASSSFLVLLRPIHFDEGRARVSPRYCF